MRKYFISFLISIIATFLFAGVSFASTSLRLEQPKSPTNQNNFSLIFVALTTDNSPITVTCLKQAPGDASLTEFASVPLTGNSGNSGNCPIDSSIVNTAGTYTFQVQANDITSNTVTVDYNTNAPGTPSNYSKDHPSSCQYVIKFHTASDNGETVKVELYRSTSTSFSADGGSRVQTTNIGSNTDGSFTDNAADCNDSNYYAVRAFDSAGNGSGIVGDSEVHVTNPTTTTQGSGTTQGSSATQGTQSVQGASTAQPTSGAIPVVTSSVTSGDQTSVTPEPTTDQNVLGASTSKKAENSASSSNGLSTLMFFIPIVLLVILGIGFWLLRKRTHVSQPSQPIV